MARVMSSPSKRRSAVIQQVPVEAGAQQRAVEQRATRRRAGLEDLQSLAAYAGAKELPAPDLNLMVVQPIGFDGDDWELAASSLRLEARIDVVAAPGIVPEHVCRVAAVIRPDAIVLDWRSPDASALFDALHADPATCRTPVIIVSDDGERAAPRLLCGVWEDPAPEDFDDVVHLLDAINARTMVTRVAPDADARELEAWFDWVSLELPSR